MRGMRDRDMLMGRWGLAIFVLVVVVGLTAWGRVGSQGTEKSQRPVSPASPEAEWGRSDLKYKILASCDLQFVLNATSGTRVRLVVGDQGKRSGQVIEFGPDGIRVRMPNGADEKFGIAHKATLDDLRGQTIVYQRRPHRWSLVIAGEVAAYGDSAPPEGAGVSLLVKGGDVAVKKLRFTNVPAVYFTDGFMRTPEDPTSWDELSGTWGILSVHNPYLSSNAFRYKATGEKASAITGKSSWGDMNFSVACRAETKGAMGVYFCYRGPEDYYLFRWATDDSKTPVRQIIRRKDGKDTILAESEGGCSAKQWYTLQCLVGAGWVRIGVDDESIFTVRDSGIAAGKIGLYGETDVKVLAKIQAERKQLKDRGNSDATIEKRAPLPGMLFDDVVVARRPARLLAADGRRASDWLKTGGDWLLLAAAPWDRSGMTGGMVVTASEDVRLTWQQPGWENYSLSARLAPWKKGVMGFVFGYADEANYYSVEWRKAEKPMIALKRITDGEVAVLAERAWASDDKAHGLAMRLVGGNMTVSVDGKDCLSAFDSHRLGQRVGLLAGGVGPGSFGGIICESLPAPLPVSERSNPAHGAEKRSMSAWSQSGSDWVAKRFSDEAGLGISGKAYWHQLDLAGDLRIDMRLAQPPEKGEVGLVLNGDGSALRSAVIFRLMMAELAPDDQDKPHVVLQALRDEKVLKSVGIDWAAGSRLLSARRSGKTIRIFLGNRFLMSFDDDNPAGVRWAWYAVNEKVELDDISLYSSKLINYSFKSAPTEWREGGGVWEVSNKWECDPRWTFFSGRCPTMRNAGLVSDDDAKKKVVAIWNKRSLKGDFTIEYFVGQMMDRSRGKSYSYARDLNLSFCADGSDLTSGYAFVFGGHGNTGSMLYRRGELWAERAGFFVDPKGLHRRWYHIRVTRIKGEITVAVSTLQSEGALDDKRVKTQVFKKTDPNPIAGGQFALWTYDNGFIIGRVRISADEIGPLESVDTKHPKTTQSLYNE
jgi:hypothetical protein